MAQAVERLPHKHKAQNSNPNTTRKKKKKEKKKGINLLFLLQTKSYYNTVESYQF
jgi:hypothetical protein